MCEYRIHWVENGVIQYRWHGTMNQARRDVRRLRKRLCRTPSEINSHKSVVKFTLVGSTVRQFLEFCYEHTDDACPQELHRMRKVDLLAWLNENVREGPTIGPIRRAA